MNSLSKVDTKKLIDNMTVTVGSADNFPQNYQSDSQLKMLEKFRYILHLSNDLNLHTASQKTQIIRDRLTIYKIE